MGWIPRLSYQCLPYLISGEICVCTNSRALYGMVL